MTDLTFAAAFLLGLGFSLGWHAGTLANMAVEALITFAFHGGEDE